MHPEIAASLNAYRAAESIYRKTVARVQSECAHPKSECFESKSTRETYTNGCGYGTSSTGRKPYIVCRLCGYAECAWHGKDKMKYYGLPEITLRQADEYRVGAVHEWEDRDNG